MSKSKMTSKPLSDAFLTGRVFANSTLYALPGDVFLCVQTYSYSGMFEEFFVSCEPWVNQHVSRGVECYDLGTNAVRLINSRVVLDLASYKPYVSLSPIPFFSPPQVIEVTVKGRAMSLKCYVAKGYNLDTVNQRPDPVGVQFCGFAPTPIDIKKPQKMNKDVKNANSDKKDNGESSKKERDSSKNKEQKKKASTIVKPDSKNDDSLNAALKKLAFKTVDTFWKQSVKDGNFVTRKVAGKSMNNLVLSSIADLGESSTPTELKDECEVVHIAVKEEKLFSEILVAKKGDKVFELEKTGKFFAASIDE